MSASWSPDENPAIQSMLRHFEQQLVEDIVGTFDPDPYRRKAEYVEVPLSKKKVAKLLAAAALLSKHDVQVENTVPTTKKKRRWTETEEEWQHRLATLPEHRVDWIRQQLAEGKKPQLGAWVGDRDLQEALGIGDGTVTFPVKQTPID